MKRIIIFVIAAFFATGLVFSASITVLSPAAADEWSVGSNYSITWTRSGAMPDQVTIRLRRAGSSNSDPAAAVIAAEAANTGSGGTCRWTIPASVTAGRYFVRVKTVGSPAGTPEVGNDSPDFTILTSAVSAIIVTSPDTSSSWRPGSRQTIEWTKSGALNPMANITLRREGAPDSEAAVARIADGCANNGSFFWFIPESLAEGRYFVRVKSGAVQDDSAAFAISTTGRGSDLPGPDTPIRADLELVGVGVEYNNGHVVAWVKNNGPDSVRDHDVTFRLHFPEREPTAHIITQRITVPVGSEERVRLMMMSRNDIPEAGLRTSVSIDAVHSHIQDADPLNQHRDIRIFADSRPPIDLEIQLDRGRTVITHVLVATGKPFVHKYHIRGWMRLRNLSAAPVEIASVKCRWVSQVRNTFETEWDDGIPASNGSLQLGPFRRGEWMTCLFEFDFLVHDFKSVVYHRVFFELDPDHLLNDPNRSNNMTASDQWDHK